MASPARPRRPLSWVGGSKKNLDDVPEDVKDVFGASLLDLQYGDVPAGAKPFGEGLPREIWKIVEDHDGNTYRGVYTAAFPEVVYVLDVFMKKSTSGVKTPQVDKDRVHQRFKAARRHYDANYRKVTMARKMRGTKPAKHIEIETSGGNVFADLGLPHPAERLAKAELARVIRKVVSNRGWTQARAAKAVGIAPPDMSDLMRGKLARFSQERLERFLNALDMDVQIRVGPRPTGKKRATVTVEVIGAF